MRTEWRFNLVLALAVLLAACGRQTPAGPQYSIEVWKSPTCSCCKKWVEYLQREGFKVTVHEEPAMNPLKAKLGVPEAVASCHTGLVNGYVIEGHVPAEDIRKLLVEKPKTQGLSAPGMPIGSPGMEVDGQQEPYETVLFNADGTTKTFAEHGGRPAVPTKP
ncbi:Uncharacterized conserved protein [Solimonas aquatica]|uniref:Uncharacterized conserved protein n=1 Tax=Solimonas aquatica TaxID=489703 RepID=A0A1H9DWN4_9GAMM|nr:MULTISPECIES: DUF411 domain-containing protein [Solimonas]SEQ17752.1 Uncharacterized conserved protein [Solimonas aquatica]